MRIAISKEPIIRLMCGYPALFITRATGTLVNTPTNPGGEGGGIIVCVCDYSLTSAE